MAEEVHQESTLADAGAAGSLRGRRRGREEDESEDESESILSLLSAPPEVMSVIMLCLGGATLAQASCVCKVCAWCTYGRSTYL